VQLTKTKQPTQHQTDHLHVREDSQPTEGLFHVNCFPWLRRHLGFTTLWLEIFTKLCRFYKLVCLREKKRKPEETLSSVPAEGVGQQVFSIMGPAWRIPASPQHLPFTLAPKVVLRGLLTLSLPQSSVSIQP